MIEDCDSDTRETVKLQAIRILCNNLLMIMLNCLRVNESCTVDITELLIHKLSAVFATKNLLELGGDECDNLNFMNFKIDSFKIRKNSWILGTFKIHKIRILNLWSSPIGADLLPVLADVHSNLHLSPQNIPSPFLNMKADARPFVVVGMSVERSCWLIFFATEEDRQ